MFLRLNRDLVLGFYNEFGPELTKQQFCLSHDTLDRLVKFEHRPYQPPFSKADKAQLTAEIAEEGVRQCRREVEELKEQFQQFQQSVSNQMVEKFFVPMLQSVIRVDKTLIIKPKQDKLCLEGVKK